MKRLIFFCHFFRHLEDIGKLIFPAFCGHGHIVNLILFVPVDLDHIGNPFLNINRNKIYNINKYVVLETILDLMNIIVSSGSSDDDKNQGSILVLMSLNEVVGDCGRSNNWLI